MRSHEFVTEAITISNYRTLFTNTILSSIKSALETFGDMQGSLVKSVEFSLQNTKSVKQVAFKFQDEFRKILQDSLTEDLSKIILEILNQRYPNVEPPKQFLTRLRKVTFLDMNFGGAASLLDILLNSRFVLNISYIIIDFINDNYLDLIDYDTQSTIIDQFFNSVKALASTDALFYETSLIDEVFKLSNIILHELVHVFQHAEQFKKGRTSTEYRSYLEKDLAKFQAAVYGSNIPDNRRIYVSSPQEITAFAHMIVNQIIKEFDLEQYPNNIEQSQFYDIISHYLIEHLQYTPNQIKTLSSAEKKVFNRYAKQIYQILQNYIETQNKELED